MSRIIVKQLPKNINKETIRNIFSTKGTITDLQLKYTKDGKFRQFCYVGYQSESEAREAVKAFNDSCIHTRKIKVELSDNLGESTTSKITKKHVKPDQDKQQHEANGVAKTKFIDLLEKHKNDPNFVEFLETHENRTLWANDVGDSQKETNIKNNEQQQETDDNHKRKPEDVKLSEKPISDLDYMKSLISKKTIKLKSANLDLFTIKIHNVPYRAKRKDIVKFFKPLKPYSIRLPAKVHGFCYVGFKTERELHKALLKNRSFINGKQVFFTDFTSRNKINKAKKEELEKEKEENLNNPLKTSKWEQQKENFGKYDISESGCIFFRNLSYTVCLNDLQKLFGEFGPLADIDLPIDPLTKQIKGFGTVTYVMPENALQAFNKLDGTTFAGRLLHLIPGKVNIYEDDNKESNNSNLTFKEKKSLKQKQSAEQSYNWNTLFLGANTVADLLAQKFQTSKENILDTRDGGSSAAVRLALGETQLVIETKRFLEENGVQINVFDTKATKHSMTTMLAKNLPSNTTADELMEIFKKFGQINRLILPPNGVTAIIEFDNASEAKKAFRKLAYSKFKHSPLYLEWAPEAVFQAPAAGNNNSNANTTAQIDTRENETESTIAEAALQSSPIAIAKDDEATTSLPEDNTTLFLKNLNFQTVEATIYEHFKAIGAIHTVEIAKRRTGSNPQEVVSLGYGFIQFKRAADADKALKTMQSSTIDNNRVELKRSDRLLRSNLNAKNMRKSVSVLEQTGSKILVRNIPFQAKENEVRDIFKAFGELRSVRLPKKSSTGENSIRGFGFVDYISKSDAKRAFEALSQSTHLYGRRLVLEWAASSKDNDILELRKRAAQEGNSSDTQAQKKLKLETMLLASSNGDENE